MTRQSNVYYGCSLQCDLEGLHHKYVGGTHQYWINLICTSVVNKSTVLQAANHCLQFYLWLIWCTMSPICLHDFGSIRYCYKVHQYVRESINMYEIAAPYMQIGITHKQYLRPKQANTNGWLPSVQQINAFHPEARLGQHLSSARSRR